MMHEPWAFICEIGFWGWVLATVGFILKAFPRRDVMRKGLALQWGVSILVFYAVWIAGMVNS